MVKKITRAMVTRAENAHFRSETYPTLVKSHALSYLYYKQRKKMGMAREYLTSSAVRMKVKKLEGGKK